MRFFPRKSKRAERGRRSDEGRPGPVTGARRFVPIPGRRSAFSGRMRFFPREMRARRAGGGRMDRSISHLAWAFWVGFRFQGAPARALWATFGAGELHGVGAEFHGASWTAGGVLTAHKVLSVESLFHLAPAGAAWTTFCACESCCFGAALRGASRAYGGVLRAHGLLSTVGMICSRKRCSGRGPPPPLRCRAIRSTLCTQNRLSRTARKYRNLSRKRSFNRTTQSPTPRQSRREA